jgi:hypothetical protein
MSRSDRRCGKEDEMKITKVEVKNGKLINVDPTDRELEVVDLMKQADALFKQGRGKDAAAVMGIMIDRFVNLPKEEK